MIDETLLKKLFPEKSEANKVSKMTQESLRTTYPIVTQADATNGYLTRYFARPANDDTFIVEIDKNQYDSVSANPRFLTASLKWKIVGKKESSTTPTGIVSAGVEEYNRKITDKADLTFDGLRSYITDYLQFWQSED